MTIYSLLKFLIIILTLNIHILEFAFILFLFERILININANIRYNFFRFSLFLITFISIFTISFSLKSWTSVNYNQITDSSFQYLALLNGDYAKLANLFRFNQIVLVYKIWLGLAVAFFICFSVSNSIRKRNLLKQSFLNPKLEKELNQLKAINNINRKIAIFYCPIISSPAITGLLSPIIFIPIIHEDNFMNYLTIKHELFHYKNKDLWIKTYIAFLKCLFWFNPTLHYIDKHFEMVCDLSCDADVVNDLTLDQKFTYMETIVDTIENSLNYKEKPPYLSLVKNNKSSLVNRFKLILTYSKGYSKILLSLVFALAVLLCNSNIYALSYSLQQACTNYDLYPIIHDLHLSQKIDYSDLIDNYDVIDGRIYVPLITGYLCLSDLEITNERNKFSIYYNVFSNNYEYIIQLKPNAALTICIQDSVMYYAFDKIMIQSLENENLEVDIFDSSEAAFIMIRFKNTSQTNMTISGILNITNHLTESNLIH